MPKQFAHSELLFKQKIRYKRCDLKSGVRYDRRMMLRLKEIRKAKGFTQDQVADLVGMSKSYYSEIESGKKPANTIRLESFAKALGVSVADITSGPDDPELNAHLSIVKNLPKSDREAVFRHALSLLSQQ